MKDLNLMYKVTTVVIDSRSDLHKNWVQTCFQSIANQTMETELIVVDNIGRKQTIGRCWNEAVKKATGEWVFFVGDDSFLARDCVQVMNNFTDTKSVNITTYMTVFEDETGLYQTLQRQCTGMFKRDYLLRYPFNENLEKGIDREYIEELIKRGDTIRLIPYYYGHYDRKHSDYSCAGDITFATTTSDIYILCGGGRSFIDPIANRLRKDNSVFIGSKFSSKMADGAGIIWCEWANKNAVEVSDYKCNARKILRFHAYEAFTPSIHYIDFKKFDTVIFVAQHIRDYVENKVGKLDNAVVIPVGVDLGKFSLRENIWNNKIAYAGEISRKKGIGELFLLAKQLPDYEFCAAGKFSEDDTAEFFHKKKPDNVTLEPFQYDLNRWFEDKTYILNTSIREGIPVTVLQGMSAGLKPLIYDWVGAEEAFKPEWIWKDFYEFSKILLYVNPPEYREFVKERYDFEDTYKQIEKVMELNKIEVD